MTGKRLAHELTSATCHGLGVVALGVALSVAPGCSGAESVSEEPIDGRAEASRDRGGGPQGGGGGSGGQGSVVPGDAGAAPSGHCMAGITAYDRPGPFKHKSLYKGLVKMWVPDVPKGCKVPMVHLSNGTGAFCDIYRPSLERLASHGFLALCFESPLTGTGDPGMIAFDAALKEYPELADHKFGSTGHSQGGQAALVTLQYAEARWGAKGVYAGLAMQPASGFGLQPLTGLWPTIYGKIKSPVFMFSGLVTDGLVPAPWVTSAFLAMNDKTEAHHWMRALSTHIPVPNFEEEQISIPWFRWKLLGDAKACEYFKSIPKKDPLWILRDQQNVPAC